MPIITASSRGQVVIPKDLRKQLNIGPGRRLLLRLQGDSVLMTPLPENPAEQSCGVFEQGPSLTRELLKERSKDRARESKKAAR